ncbi:MAG: DegT/DnrJ/EryC1/StrS aminotransferase family protein, partial [Bacteriovoracaceae bacterium]|nr:DegT/DnrJ/EryC1/StrS aminotransferase family protein [Bacteriovoracaceae bacterium]
RKALAAEYYTALKSLPIKLLPEKMLKTSSWHLFPIFVKNSQEKMALHEFLKKKEIASSTTYYQMSLTLEPTLKQFAGDCPNAITFAEQSFCLPMHPFLTSQDILEIANALKTFYS